MLQISSRFSVRLIAAGLMLLAPALMGHALAQNAAPAGATGQVKVSDQLPSYQKVSGISGTLNSAGSDSMLELMHYWAEAFMKLYPSVTMTIEGKGSATAPPALAAGTAQLGPMSRAMKSDEQDGFETKYGFKPTQVPVALDSLAIYVNKNNPLDKISLQEADAVFSKTRLAKYYMDIATWGPLGLKGEWAEKPISIYGRNSASGTYSFFKEHVMRKGDFKDTVKEQPGSSSVVQGVTEELGAIGYSGIGYKTSGVKALALSKMPGQPAVTPSYENVLNGKYPLSRALLIYVVKEPGKSPQPLVTEFIKFALSKEGQTIVAEKAGYMPMTPEMASKAAAGLQ